jgi:hypothetical protein
MATAFTSSAQNTDAHAATDRSNSSSASRNSTTAVSAPASALGTRSAVSSAKTSPVRGWATAFHASAILKDPVIASFISMGCSGSAVKSPRPYAATARSLSTSSSASPLASR